MLLQNLSPFVCPYVELKRRILRIAAPALGELWPVYVFQSVSAGRLYLPYLFVSYEPQETVIVIPKGPCYQ